MKLTVIGYWGAFPGQGSATSCYLLETSGKKYLIDCGSGSLSRLQYYTEVMDLDGIILSHYHHDHIADIGAIQYAWLVHNMLNKTDRQLLIYGHDENIEAFNKLSHQYTKGIAYVADQTLDLGAVTVDFMRTNHPVPCFGMRVTDGKQAFVYTADTSYSKDWATFAESADLLITDTNFYKGMDGSGPGHMTSEEAGKVAAGAGVSTLWLSHLPHFGDHQLLVKEAGEVFKKNIQLAREGLVWRSEG
ncbi:MBL fold metallo-hydrolase [Thalassobacillus hwangdonensis]|uniref:MBL fold metallo-hydrolase n=1 Tax=Thalassobacillus hwangdonensis TaxID=546108 RepID=A0ABW3KV86_9BACI